MAYRSGQFPIYQNINNYNEFQSDAVIFNNNVVVISSWGLDGGIDLVETVFPLKDLIAQNPDNPTEPINDQKLKLGVSWTSTDILTGTNSNKPALAALPALNADTLFTFYSSRNFPDLSYAGIRAIRYHLDDSDQNKDNHWSPVIALLDSDGANMPVPAFDVELSSKVVGDNIVIVACASASQQSKLGAVYDDRNKRGGTFIGVYDKTKIDLVANEWKAESSFYLPIPADIDDYDINRVMIEWIQKIGATLEYELLVVTASKKMDANNFSHKMLASTAQMTISDKGGVTLSNFAPVAGTGDDANPVKFSNDQRPPAPYFMATLQRDPAGRLRSWFQHR